jgi:hypothetical protein
MVQIGDAELPGHLLERPVAAIAIQPVLRSFLAVGDVEVGQTVAIEIDHRHGGTHRRHLRHDVRQLGVERRRGVHVVDAGRLRRLGQLKAVLRERADAARRCGGAGARWKRRIRNGVASSSAKDDHHDEAGRLLHRFTTSAGAASAWRRTSGAT